MKPTLFPTLAFLLLLLASPSPAQDGAAEPAPEKPAEKPAAPPATPAPAPEPPADLAAARTLAAERNCRILAVVTEEFYASEPCDRLAKALGEPEAAKAAEGFVLLRVSEKEDVAFSKSLGLEDLGHPYTAILDGSGKAQASLRGAFEAGRWAKEILRLSRALDAVDAARAAVAKDAADARALWDLSEALRDAGRVREADDVLATAERKDPDGTSGLAPLFAFRRVEARMEDRMAVQDFEGARAALDAYDRSFPNSPRRRHVFVYRALCRAHLGEADAALADLKEVAAEKKDEALSALAAEKAASLEKVIAARK